MKVPAATVLAVLGCCACRPLLTKPGSAAVPAQAKPTTLAQGTLGLVTLEKGAKEAVVWLTEARTSDRDPALAKAKYGTSAVTAPVDGGLLLLFDDRGPLGIVEAERLAFTFHCENDGGRTYRPALRVPLTGLSRKPVHRAGLSNIVGFVVVGAPAPPGALETRDARLSADVDGDRKPDAVLFTTQAEAGCGSAGAERPYSFGVRGRLGEAVLDCCGP